MRARRCTPRILRRTAVAAIALVALTAATSASGSDTRSTLKVVPPTTCGQNLVYQQADPNKVLPSLSKAAQAMYKNYPFDVRSTPWAAFKGKKPPWKIGYVSFPTNNPWKVNLYAELKKEFAA